LNLSSHDHQYIIGCVIINGNWSVSVSGDVISYLEMDFLTVLSRMN